jgi:tRNA(fMet)-specific endonuclease VapC
MILLDSSVLIELFRKKDKRNTLFYTLSQLHSDLCISSITYYEVGIGNRKTHEEYWETLCESFSVLPFDRACSVTAISIYHELLKTSNMIDLADLLIGATALTHNIPIATLNIKHFERLKKLVILKS